MKKSHWITLIVLVLMIGIYIVARHTVPVQHEVRFFSADSIDIAKLEFFTPEDTVIIQKQGNEWRLSYPLVWEVNELQLKTFFEQALPVKTSSTPMSEDPNLHKMYKVDDANAIQVKIYNKSGKVLDHVYIGNGTDTSFDYGRKKGDKDIYQFKNNISSLVKPDIFQWRSPNITNLKFSQIDHVDVTYSKNSYTLTTVGDSIRYTDKNESFMIPIYNRAQYKIVNVLENLMTWQFLDKDTEQYAQEFKNPACKITVYLKNKTTKTFTMIRLMAPNLSSPDGQMSGVLILMMIDDKTTPLYQMTGDFINRFTRSANHFKSEYE